MDDLISRKALIEKHCAENCGCTRGECGLSYEEDGCDACTFVKEVEAGPHRRGRACEDRGVGRC